VVAGFLEPELMIKFNRIGNKLGLVGLVGIALALGMAANQMMSEFAVGSANQQADNQRLIAEHALDARVELRRMQIAERDIKSAVTPEETEKALRALGEAGSAATTAVDLALEKMARPENAEWLQKVKSLLSDYFNGAKALGKTQLKILDLVKQRNASSAEWAKLFKAQLASPALAQAANRLDIERALAQADSSFNALMAASWRFAATYDRAQKLVIGERTTDFTDVMARARELSNGTDLPASIDALSTSATTFFDITHDVMQQQTLMRELVQLKTLPMANQAAELVQTAVDMAEKLAAESKADAAAELARANRINLTVLIVVIASLVGSVIFSFLGVARPLTRLNNALGKMASGELDVEIPGAGRGDEVGDIAKTVLVIRENAEQKAHEEGEAKVRQDEIIARQRRADMIRLADSFETAVGEIVETVSSASTELEASATTLTSTAERSQGLATTVAAASEEAYTNVRSVASATEELSSSVNQISRQVQESARIASEAVGQARKTNDRVGELSKAAARIGDVVELINTIAGQTNLLALNATIEAARAGDAGRGFAVVASEVKALAEQTAKATGEIGQQISGIQAATQESVGAIKEIGGTIERLSEISSAIAAAVEQQGTATREISRNVQQAALGTQQVSATITDVQRGASETGSASSQVLSSAQTLSSDSNRLKAEVGRFLDTVRAA
jgi:methyl-accepting chemotaxis protein